MPSSKILFITFILLGFSSLSARDMDIPATQISFNEVGNIIDDGSATFMNTAIERQLAAFRRSSLRGNLNIDGQTIPMSILEDTMKEFKTVYNRYINCKNSQGSHCVDQFNESLKNQFNWYKPKVSGQTSAHYTGYYSPTFPASKTKNGDFRYGLYRIPSRSGDRVLTRNEILFDDALEGKGLELFYMDDPFELFLLHVEGGGVVEIMENGVPKRIFLSYAGTNGQSFSFIGGYMKSRGYIKDTSIKSQRTFLKNNPDKWQEIYGQTPSYVYMKVTKTEPLGMENIPLTPGRSMAQDRHIFWRKGLMGFVRATIPDFSRRGDISAKTGLNRFFIDQDTGGAIRGEARADLYWGYGAKAQYLAETMDDHGKMFFFIKKN